MGLGSMEAGELTSKNRNAADQGSTNNGPKEGDLVAFIHNENGTGTFVQAGGPNSGMTRTLKSFSM